MKAKAALTIMEVKIVMTLKIMKNQKIVRSTMRKIKLTKKIVKKTKMR